MLRTSCTFLSCKAISKFYNVEYWTKVVGEVLAFAYICSPVSDAQIHLLLSLDWL